jgi:hypothetical protein
MPVAARFDEKIIALLNSNLTQEALFLLAAPQIDEAVVSEMVASAARYGRGLAKAKTG